MTVTSVSAAQTQPLHADRPVDAVLTMDELAQLTAFWTAFAQEADSIRRPQLMTLGTSVPLVVVDTVYSGGRIDRTELVQNITALATQYPSVAVDLTRAGLTSSHYHYLFVTLLNACRTFNGISWGNPVTPTPLEAKNIAFLQAHRQEFDTLLASAGAYKLKGNHMMVGLNGQQRLGVGDCVQMAQSLYTADTAAKRNPFRP